MAEPKAIRRATEVEVILGDGEGVIAKATSVTEVSEPLMRFMTIATMPKGTYQPWQQKQYSVILEKSSGDKTKYESLLEVFITIENQNKKERTVEISTRDVALESSGRRITPFEVFPGEMCDYSYLKQRLSLTQAPRDSTRPKEGLSLYGIPTIEFSGTMYTTLQPKQKTWLVVVFPMQQRLEKGKVILKGK
jgi:hypothetical protein